MKILIYSGTGNFSWKTGDATPAPQKVEVTHRFPFLGYPDYNDFRLKVFVSYFNTSVEWLKVTGGGLVDGIKHPISASNTISYIEFNNLDLLPTGDTHATIYYYLEGFDGVAWRGLEERNLVFYLNTTAGNQIKTEKDLYTVFYNKQSNTISGETHINILNNDAGTELFFEGDGSTFFPGNSFTDGFDLLFATGNLLPFEGEYLMNAFLRKMEGGNYQRVYPFKIKVIIINAEVVVSPKSLSFEVRKSTQEIKTLPLSIINPFGKEVNIITPDWLTIDKASGNSTFEVAVSNANPLNLAPGKLTGNIEVKYDDVTILVAVELKVIQFFTHNLQEQYNFCLDKKEIDVYKNLQSARFVRITATMIFRTPTETKELIIPYTIPYFKDKVNLKIGKNIHRYFIKNRTSIFEEGTLIYHFDNKVHLYPCEASFKIEELDIDQVSIFEESFTGIKFYPGKKPRCFPFLTNFDIRSRAYDSKHIFSFISGLVTAEEIFDINVTKNGLEDGCIARIKVERQENKITWSDEKEITAGGKTLRYYNTQDGKDMINIQWENQNLSPESITFKGASNKPEEFTNLFQDNVFTGETEKFDTTSSGTLNISTGFILKAEEDLIYELMFSKFCIIEKGGKYIKAAPSSSKLIFEDITKQLIEFDLEFKINGN